MKQQIEKILLELREYCLSKGAEVFLRWQQERSHFVRYANSAISLNTSEELCRLEITAYGNKKQAQTSVMVDPSDLAQMKAQIDEALCMLTVAGEMSYQPSLATIEQQDHRACYDEALAQLTGAEIIDFVSQAVAGLESEDVVLSGNFSTGVSELAWLSTKTAEMAYWQATDAQVTLVLSSVSKKWEINAEQSAVRKSDLDAAALHAKLAFLLEAYTQFPAEQIPLGSYRIVFASAALAEYLVCLRYAGPNGDYAAREMGMHKLSDKGSQIFSEKFSLSDDPTAVETFAVPYDFAGYKRSKRYFYDKGVLSDFAITQECADEFALVANGSDVKHLNLCLAAGAQAVSELADLRELAREKDILYIHYMHYMGYVSVSEGLFTGTSRFGALLFKQDGSIVVPYNVRLTQRVTDLFGPKLLWLSQEREVYNYSNSYDMRNPEAILLPKFCAVDDVPIAHSNDSY